MQLSPARSYVRHHQRCAVDALGSIARRPLATMLTILVVGLALSLPLLLIILSHNFDKLTGPLEASGSIVVYFDPALADDSTAQLAAELGRRPDVESVDYIGKSKALETLAEDPDWSSALSALSVNPLPAAAVVKPLTFRNNSDRSAATGGAADTAALALQAALRLLPGIDSVASDDEWLHRLGLIRSFLASFFAMLISFFAVVVAVIVANTVRLNVEARREVILVTQMIGGSRAFVRRPFLYLGLFYSIRGMIVAALVAQGAAISLESALAPLMQSYAFAFTLDWPELDALTGFALLGTALCIGSAFLAASFQIRKIEGGL